MVSAQHVAKTPGQELPAALARTMSTNFGHDFSHVRVHSDRQAAASAADYASAAYTFRSHIVFGANQYQPDTEAGRRLLAHELTHVVQADRGGSAATGISSPSDASEQEASQIAAVGQWVPDIFAGHRLTALGLADLVRPIRSGAMIQRSPDKDKSAGPGKPPGRSGKTTKCEELPGGSTDCAVDKRTGIPTGKVTSQIDDTNPCTRPCVEKHEAVHVEQLKKFCPQLRDCYLAADKGKRPATECVAMAIFGQKEKECAAYRVSVPCVENRLATAKECQSPGNKEFGTRKLASEICFRDVDCGSVSSK